MDNELQKVRSENDRLNALYLKEIADRKLAEELLVQQNDHLSKLNQFSVDLAMLSSEDSLEGLIAKRLKEISGAKVAMISSYDILTRTMATEKVEMDTGLLRSFLALAGDDHKQRFEVSEEIYQHLIREVYGVRKTLYEMSFGSFPRALGAAVQTLLRIDRFIGLAFVIEGKLYGVALLGMSKEVPDPPRKLIESFVFLAAVSLRRKKAEQALHDSYEVLNKITDQVPGVVYQYRLYPDGHSAFPIASAGMYDIYGVTPEEVRDDATPVFSRLHPDDYQMIVDTITESARTQTFYHSEFRVILPGKGVCWRSCKARPSRLDDGSTMWYGIITDITERKLEEAELKKAMRKAEESDKLKSAFLANISHEIRTPMNGILGFAELLKEPDLTGHQQQEYIRIIESSGERMLSIINNIVDISKIESGQMKVILTETNINDLLGFIFKFFKPEVEKKGMQIRLTTGLSGHHGVINTDHEKLDAILTNFVKNAVKYTHEGTIHLGYEKKNGFIEFYVKDNGPGIPVDRHLAIFERFVQDDSSGIRYRQGAGLGLSISKAYAEMLGGKIWVESEPGKGSAFYVSIPH